MTGLSQFECPVCHREFDAYAIMICPECGLHLCRGCVKANGDSCPQCGSEFEDPAELEDDDRDVYDSESPEEFVPDDVDDLDEDFYFDEGV